MKRQLTIHPILLTALLSLLPALTGMGAGQVCAQTFRTQAPSSVGLDETFRVQYVVSTSDAEAFRCPESADFSVLGGPSTSTYSSMQWVNGKSSRSSSITYTYILQALRTGKLQLPRPTVKVGGKTLQATAATINVTKGAQGGSASRQQAPRSADDDDTQYDLRTARTVTQSDLFVRCTSSKQTLCEQEPVVLTYKVYAKAGVGLSNIVPRRKPEMQGFWTQEVSLPSNLKPSYEKIGNATYRVFTFMQYVAFPQQTGTLTIPALQTDCSVIQRDPNIDAMEAFFNGGGNLSTQLQRNSSPLTLTVKPLPTPRPAGFSGGVGRLSAEGKLLTATPATNDIATYRITISGQGNMKLITAPAIAFPKTFDAYDPKTTDETRITYDGIAGRITFDYTFVPREEGSFTIPATDFIYYDIADQTYRTIHLPATPLQVKKGLRSEADVERELALRQSNIKPDHTVSGATSGISWMCFWILLALGIVAAIATDRLLGMPLAQKFKERWLQSGHQRNKHLAQAERALKEGDAKTFYASLEHALTAANVPTDTIADTLSCRYAPDASTPETLHRTMEAARRLLPLLLIFLAPCLNAGADDSIAVQTPFVSASDSTYNAGNEAYRLKDYAQAVLCYSRALWMDPDNADARYNLSLVQTRLEDQFSVPQEMFFKTWTRTLRTSHGASTWLAWSLACFLLMLLSIVIFRHTSGRIMQRVLFYAALLLLIAFADFLTFAIMQQYAHDHNAQAVVMAEEAPCFDSPVARKKATTTLHAGTLLTIADTYGKEWVEVTLPDTRSFWISRKHITKVSTD